MGDRNSGVPPAVRVVTTQSSNPSEPSTFLSHANQPPPISSAIPSPPTQSRGSPAEAAYCHVCGAVVAAIREPDGGLRCPSCGQVGFAERIPTAAPPGPSDARSRGPAPQPLSDESDFVHNAVAARPSTGHSQEGQNEAPPVGRPPIRRPTEVGLPVFLRRPDLSIRFGPDGTTRTVTHPRVALPVLVESSSASRSRVGSGDNPSSLHNRQQPHYHQFSQTSAPAVNSSHNGNNESYSVHYSDPHMMMASLHPNSTSAGLIAQQHFETASLLANRIQQQQQQQLMNHSNNHFSSHPQRPSFGTPTRTEVFTLSGGPHETALQPAPHIPSLPQNLMSQILPHSNAVGNVNNLNHSNHLQFHQQALQRHHQNAAAAHQIHIASSGGANNEFNFPSGGSGASVGGSFVQNVNQDGQSIVYTIRPEGGSQLRLTDGDNDVQRMRQHWQQFLGGALGGDGQFHGMINFLFDVSGAPAYAPTPSTILNRLVSEVLTEATAVGDCPVCQEDFVKDEQVTRLATNLSLCGHTFHTSCIMPWLRQHNTCPVCRLRLPRDDLEIERRLQEQRRQSQSVSGTSNERLGLQQVSQRIEGDLSQSTSVQPPLSGDPSTSGNPNVQENAASSIDLPSASPAPAGAAETVLSSAGPAVGMNGNDEDVAMGATLSSRPSLSEIVRAAVAAAAAAATDFRIGTTVTEEQGNGHSSHSLDSPPISVPSLSTSQHHAESIQQQQMHNSSSGSNYSDGIAVAAGQENGAGAAPEGVSENNAAGQAEEALPAGQVNSGLHTLNEESDREARND